MTKVSMTKFWDLVLGILLVIGPWSFASGWSLALGHCVFSPCLRQLAIRDPMRPLRFNPQPLSSIYFVLGIVAIEKHDLRIAFERKDVRRDTIEKPAVVADHDGASGEVFQRF